VQNKKMLLTISTTHEPATDLGYLLYKNPSEVQSFQLSFGSAHVFYPETTAERCTVALLLDIDTIDLVRGRRDGQALDQYVNDRPYVASSFLSVAIAQVFGSALSGKSRERQELANAQIPLEAKIAALPCAEGEDFLRKLFEPLGYNVDISSFPVDPHFPDWGMSSYFSVSLKGTKRLSELLNHLYVLIPVLDDGKHYWVGDDEVEKLLRHGKDWLSTHPQRDTIAKRYLKHRRSLANDALTRLTEGELPDPDSTEEKHATEEAALEARISLNEQRLNTVVAVLKRISAKRLIDLGCGEGNLLKALMKEREFEKIVGMDVSHRALDIAEQRLGMADLPDHQKERINLMQGSLIYKDKRMEGFDAATCIEVIEHLDPYRLDTFEKVLFQFAQPKSVILTTPNIEYNCKFERLPSGQFRHKDHRFEWTRDEFRAWANRVAREHKYSVEYFPVGTTDDVVGPPTQMAVFSK
jgi:3' terminal RNA ribose 2'-O-methyltransferase Hen1